LQIQQVFNTYPYDTANWWRAQQKPCLQQQLHPKYPSQNLDILLRRLHDQCFSEDYAYGYLARDSVLEQVMGYKMLFCRKMPTYWQLGYFKVPKGSTLTLEDLDIDDGPREAERDLGYVLAKLQSQQVFFTYPYELIDRDSVFDKLRGLKLLVGFVPKHDEIECVLAYVNLLRGQTCTTFVCYMSASEM
uniref:Uncharacterized protein n=1 Tax=Heligmosomoides polygyrus TaxID=6339 RepID=A0A8L8KRF4_HELPZ